MFCDREIYQAKRWMDDERVRSPMISCQAGQIFVNDFIIILNRDLAKVKTF